MRHLPTWVRLFVLGMGWGAACGMASAAAVVIARVAAGGGDGENLYQLVVGTAFEGALACAIGAKVGCALGCATGLFAGFVLTIAARVTTAAIASWTTITVVLVAQALVEVAIFGMPTTSNLWAYAVVPAITVVPMTFAVLQQVRITRSAVTV